MKIGTLEHRDLFCRRFVESHVAFEPELLPWPQLEGELLARLRSFPFWSYARTIERRAGLMVTAFAQTLADPVIRHAVALQGYEETLHARIMQHVLDRYGIEAVELDLPPAPATRESFLVFGFGECRDSFLGFGAFALAEQAEYFPRALLTVFERVLLEEARHITFFVNWFRYEEARAGRDNFFARAFIEARALLDATLQTTFNDRPQELAAPGAGAPEDLAKFFPGLTPARFLEIALDANRRFMRGADPRLA
ncbi:MAG: ferritin-like domain-containing protein, partial [Candidatus Baltobacteraceae bacterium]